MNIALVLSGGVGTRLGGEIPKQYIEVNGRPVIAYCLDVFFAHPQIDAVQVVAAPAWRDFIEEWLGKFSAGESGKETETACRGKWRGFSEPGETRQLSIYNGLRDILSYAEREDVVIIHDAARPSVSPQMVTECFSALDGHDGALPVLPVKDTVYRSEDGKKVSGLLERDRIYAGQAPEAFVLGKYYDAVRALLPERIRKIRGSAEPAVLSGLDIVMIPGDEGNFKITTGDDLERFRGTALRT